MTGSKEFRFDLGSLSLNFVATVGSRNSLSPVERIPTPYYLKQWLIQSGLLGNNDDQIELSQSDLDQAIILREALYRFIHDFVHHKKINSSDLQIINQFSSKVNTLPSQLCENEFGELFLVSSKDQTLLEMLGCIAIDIIHLVTGDEKKLLRECGGFSCDGIYLDRSRGFRRLWCSSKTCGNAERVDRHRTKIKKLQ
ncbi:hypothetical protein F901_01798 [Acinetobacter dispersus]|uniref:CGNR zinc finger domain-containing protein n=1 Tax=Acinetobacter dispersus TaxID=70348 RepID=UPI0002CDAC20|nr:ABATE domain-containing protein [Acinetobacter dispersus]ENX54490.1 hypothetical protein F901_01798 [Acinetobacter dispersus]